MHCNVSLVHAASAASAGSANQHRLSDLRASVVGSKRARRDLLRLGRPRPAGVPATEELRYGLSNSTSGYFPTSNYLDFAFERLANEVTYTFNNFGDGGIDGVGYTFATYFGADGGVLGTQQLVGAVSQLVFVGYSDIAAIRFDNNSNGQANWLFSVSTLTADVRPASEIPEPASFALVLAGLVALARLSRRTRRSKP